MSIKVTIPKEYHYSQTEAANIWDISYPFSGVPMVDVMIDVNGNLEKTIPKKIEMVTDSRVKIYFSTPRSGVANIVA